MIWKISWIPEISKHSEGFIFCEGHFEKIWKIFFFLIQNGENTLSIYINPSIFLNKIKKIKFYYFEINLFFVLFWIDLKFDYLKEIIRTILTISVSVFINVFFLLNSFLKTNYTILKYKNRIKSWSKKKRTIIAKIIFFYFL